MADEKKRIIDLAELSQEVQEGQYILVDSAGGTGKMNLKKIADDSKEGLANEDGYYPNLYAGNLISDRKYTDSVPYLMRKTAGGASKIGEREDDTLVGATVNVNQLVDVDTSSVTIQNSHKYYAKISGTKSIGASTGAAISVTGGTDIVTDLTDYFGSTIADYLYSLEQAAAGAGIAKLREWGFLTEDYYEHNLGSLESVQTTAHVMRDADNNIIGYYDLGTDTLRGLFKLDANNNLYADGDRKTSDGTITRRYGVVEFNSTIPSSKDSKNRWTLSMRLNNFIEDGLNRQWALYNVYPAICNKGTMIIEPNAQEGDFSWSIYGHASYVEWRIRIPDTYTAEQALELAKTMTLVYRINDTAEQSTPFTSPQICDTDGTEEYVTSNGVPVGHETEYNYDIKGLAEELIDVPDVPSTNGTYVLKATRTASGLSYNWVTG